MTDFRISGKMLSFSRVVLSQSDPSRFLAHLEAHRDALSGAPIILDGPQDVDLPYLMDQLDPLGVQVIAVIDGGLSRQARELGLTVLPNDRYVPKLPAEPDVINVSAAAETSAPIATLPPVLPEPTSTAAPDTPPVNASPDVRSLPLTIYHDILRSGQQMIVEQGDALLLADQNSGNELFVAGNVTSLARLRGRVLVGIYGDRSAQILCQNLQAELIGIAGHYCTAEVIPAELIGQPVHIYLDPEGQIRFEKMPALTENR